MEALNREEDLVLKDIISQGILNGTISRHKNFQDELAYAELQRELLGELPGASSEAINNLNRLLTAFPAYSPPHRLVRAAQASVSKVLAASNALADSIVSMEHQARVAIVVMKEITAKHEAYKQKERERKARSQRQRDTNQTTIMSHMVRGGLPRAAPITPGLTRTTSTRTLSAPANPSRGFRSSTPAPAPPPSSQTGKTAVETILVSSDSSENAVPAKKMKPRRSPRLESAASAAEAAEAHVESGSPSEASSTRSFGGQNLDGAMSSSSSATSPTTSASPLPSSSKDARPLSAFDFFHSVMGDVAECAMREVEIIREQARIEAIAEPLHSPIGRSDLGEQRAEANDVKNEEICPVDLTISKLM